jgi:hypothetical protein
LRESAGQTFDQTRITRQYWTKSSCEFQLAYVFAVPLVTPIGYPKRRSHTRVRR